LLSIAIRKHYPQYWHYFSIPYFNFNGKTFKNGNGLLGSYEGADGMKTGFTNKSRYSLIATARRGGRHLVSVVLGADSRAEREAVSRGLLDYGFGKTKEFRINYANQSSSTNEWTPKYEASATPSAASSGGGASGVGASGVQFGAFATEKSAKLQQDKVYALFGLETYLERFNGMLRVRAKMPVSKAEQVKSQCASRGVDCFIFK